MDAAISQLGLSLNVHRYPESACLACDMSAGDIETERRIRFSCDEFKTRAVHEGHAATVLISTAIVSALQVQEAIKAIHELNGIELEVPVQYGKKYYYHGMNHTCLQINVETKDDCISNHHTIDDEIIEAPISAKDTLGKVLDYLEDTLGYECVIDTYPDSEFVTTAKCRICDRDIEFNKPKYKIYQEDMYCDECTPSPSDGYSSGHEGIDLFGKDSAFLNYTLQDLGIPLLHVLTVRAKHDFSVIKYVELTADVDTVLPNTFGS